MTVGFIAGTTPAVPTGPTGPKYCLNDGTNPHAWVCDVDWENTGWFDYGGASSVIHGLGCPDGSEDYYGYPPCKPPIFTAKSCDLLTGWFTKAKEYCLEAQADYDQFYDWEAYGG